MPVVTYLLDAPPDFALRWRVSGPYTVEVCAQGNAWQVRAGPAHALHGCLPARDWTQEQAQVRARQQLSARLQEGWLPPRQEVAELPLQPWQPEAAHAQALLRRLHPDVWRLLPDAKRGRLIARLGELGLVEALPAVLALAEQMSIPTKPGLPALLAYTYAWTLGRLARASQGQATQQPAPQQAAALLRRWHEKAQGVDAALHHIAGVAALMLASPEQRRAQADTLIAHWPQALQETWSMALQQGPQALSGPDGQPLWQEVLAREEVWAQLPLAAWLEQLDTVMQADAYRPLARMLLMQQLRQLPWEWGHVRHLRHILKASELREDDALWVLLQHRIEQEKARFTSPVVSRGWRVSVMARPDNGIAWSHRTRQYFLRRHWRRLRRLGQLGHSRYVALATQALLGYADAAHGYDGGECDEDRAMLLYWITLSRSPGHVASAAGTCWWAVDTQALQLQEPPHPLEPFAALWDAHPQAVVLLLRHARHPVVADFAVRILRRNLARWGQVLDTLEQADLYILVCSPFAAVQTAALEVVRQRLARTHEPLERAPWLAALGRSPLPEACQLVCDAIAQAPAHYASDSALVLALLTSGHAPLRTQAQALLAQLRLLSPQHAQLEALLAWAEQAEVWSAPWEDVLPVLQAAWQTLAGALSSVEYGRLAGLLEHHVPQLVWLGAAWLIAHPHYAMQPPLASMRDLLDSDEPWRYGAGVQLFAGLSPAVHMREPQLLAVFAASPHAPAREAARPVVERLAQVRAQGWEAVSTTLAEQLADGLFRTEQGPGQHADVLALLQGPLAQATQALGADWTLRLLRARSASAQTLGAWLLPQRRHADYSVADWATLARNPLHSVRQWAWQAYSAHVEQVQQAMEAALRIFDSRWDDTRDFALTYFQQAQFDRVWNMPLLVALCDHPAAPARQLGRTLLERHVDIDSLMDYLLRLAQHPSAEMQLLVAQWLERCACDVQQLQRLQPYFVCVLSQVNRARQAKRRIQQFLHQQALQSEAAARIVAEICTRQVLTIAVGDKAQYIATLQAIQGRWPQLASQSPLHIQPLPVRPPVATATP